MKPLYHGTIYKFDEIDVSAGKGYKDSMLPQSLHTRSDSQLETRTSRRSAKAFSKTKRE